MREQLRASVEASRAGLGRNTREIQWYLRVRERATDDWVALMSEDEPRSIALYTDHTRACDDAFAIRELGWQAQVVEVEW